MLFSCPSCHMAFFEATSTNPLLHSSTTAEPEKRFFHRYPYLFLFLYSHRGGWITSLHQKWPFLYTGSDLRCWHGVCRAAAATNHQMYSRFLHTKGVSEHQSFFGWLYKWFITISRLRFTHTGWVSTVQFEPMVFAMVVEIEQKSRTGSAGDAQNGGQLRGSRFIYRDHRNSEKLSNNLLNVSILTIQQFAEWS